MTTSQAPHRPIEIADILQGIEAGEFHLVYQPQVDSRQGHLLGFESLMRWESATFGTVSPDVFIGIAESRGVIHSLWDCLLEQVVADLRQLAERDSAPRHIALNLSASQLPVPELSRHIGEWLIGHSLDGAQIHIEITESALLADSPEVMDNLRHLNELGIKLWLDDFGTGYSSLRHLVELPIHGLKIDKLFITTVEENIAHFRLVCAIIAMASSLGLKTVAEGIETENQSQILTQLGCDYFQGYLIGKPDRMDNLLASWMPDRSSQNETL